MIELRLPGAGAIPDEDVLREAVKGKEALIAAAVGVPMEVCQSWDDQGCRMVMRTAVPCDVVVGEGRIQIYQGRNDDE